MPWPAVHQYQEAIQHPALCFREAALRKGTPQLTPLGLPWLACGNFAAVCRISSDGVPQAVRLFLREAPDRRERYASISAFLSEQQAWPFVSFAYLETGIRIGGIWYPALAMDWVDGVPLNTY